eukprot:CAMPEP_0197689354 /NCGR_PEP_ID=MMETSP1338-20131121/106715_1 /TAXON_ID=43686 ORGANISM="Pelagodinium beii, Strain RCC1491" /NCGR_SAMPLE_ID=MMETSP1338 /ASSEMBLY_ACC=CAM_ASM_000754 /LENGTH=77 /DNA_ID=CAMNT_0043271679 /DNA_START=29 /DNA_END=259 /DNA_ORIENTATION=-
MIWPLQTPSTLLSKRLRKTFDHRLTFSFIPPEEHEMDEIEHVQHASLSGAKQRVAEEWNVSRKNHLPYQERELLKMI